MGGLEKPLGDSIQLKDCQPNPSWNPRAQNPFGPGLNPRLDS